jgi:urease accessory protein
MKRIVPFLSVAALLALSTSADAHPLHAGFALRDGFLHPWLGWDHLLAMLAVGLWARQARSGRSLWLLPAAFVSAMAVGATAGHWIGSVTMIEPLIAASLIGLGALLALRVQLSWSVAAAVLLPMGLVHGWAHGVELPVDASVLPFAVGFLSASAALHAAGIVIAAQLRARGVAPLLRVGGLGVTVAGCGLLLS